MRWSGWRSIAVVLALGMVADAKTHEERIEAGRKRLAEAAQREAEERPDDAEANLRAHILDPSWAASEEPIPDALLLERAADSVLTLAEQPQAPPETIEAARVLVEEFNEVAPGSGIAALTRIRLLAIKGLDQAGYWRKTADVLEEAAQRPDGAPLTTRFLLRLHDWMIGHETDQFVLAEMRVVIPDGYLRALRVLCKRACGAAMAPGPVDPELARFLEVLIRYASTRMDATPDLLEWLIDKSLLSQAIEAHALIRFRSGDLPGLSNASAAFQRILNLDEGQSKWWEAHQARYEAENWLLQVGLERTLKPFTDLGKLREKGVEELQRESQEAARGVVEDSKFREEAWRRIEDAAEHILRVRREDLAREKPVLDDLAEYVPKEGSQINCLVDLIHDATFLRSGAFPEDRLDEMLDRSLASWSGEDFKQRQWGRDAYMWAVNEALLRPDSARTDAVRTRLDAPFAHRAGILVALRARGETIEQAELDEALRKTLGDQWPLQLHGYCSILAGLARHDPNAALAMLPSSASATVEECESMIAQTLRQATGEDHGVVLAGWREWLARRK